MTSGTAPDVFFCCSPSIEIVPIKNAAHLCFSERLTRRCSDHGIISYLVQVHQSFIVYCMSPLMFHQPDATDTNQGDDANAENGRAIHIPASFLQTKRVHASQSL